MTNAALLHALFVASLIPIGLFISICALRHQRNVGDLGFLAFLAGGIIFATGVMLLLES